MTILVTAFGPFGGRSENASHLAIRELRKAMPEIRTRILPVDAVMAPKRLKQAIRQIRPDALVMLGEAAGSQLIRLETTAWNELDFRIPDNAGRLITSRPIRNGSPSTRASTLPLAEIHQLLDASGHGISYSDDPGRYLCNQLFYVACEHLESHAIRIPAGFIHLPLENDYPTLRIVDALTHVIRLLGDRPASPRA